jgi:prephenate dehydrogenase
LVSAALAASTSQEVAPLVGPGFQSTSRLAASDITMMLDILTTNQEQVLAALARYKSVLGEIEKVLREKPEDLRPQLENARQNRESIVKRE